MFFCTCSNKNMVPPGVKALASSFKALLCAGTCCFTLEHTVIVQDIGSILSTASVTLLFSFLFSEFHCFCFVSRMSSSLPSWGWLFLLHVYTGCYWICCFNNWICPCWQLAIKYNWIHHFGMKFICKKIGSCSKHENIADLFRYNCSKKLFIGQQLLQQDSQLFFASQEQAN